MTTTETHSTLHKVSSTSYRFDQVGLGYPTQAELNQVRNASLSLLKGRSDRHPDCEPFTVFVDGEMLTARRVDRFLRLVSDCYLDRVRFVLFRNFDGGVTAHFDKPRQDA